MFDTLLSFILGTLFGVCLTLLSIHLNNKRKLSRQSKIADTPATGTAASAPAEALPLVQELPPLVQHTEGFENNGNGRATLTGFEVREEEPGALDFASTETENATLEEITAIDEIALREQFLEYEWIEAERVEAQRVEAELIETARLEALQLNAETLEANRIEIDRAEAERVEADRIEADRIEAERVEAERAKAERAKAERAEAERAEVERAEAERAEAERAEAERVEAERVEAERVEAERVEAERVETENLEREFAALQAAQAAAEEAAKEVARQDLELAAKRAAETSARIAAEHAAELAAEQERQRVYQEHARAEAQARETAQQAASAIIPPGKVSKTPAEILIMVADDSKVVRVKTSRVLTKHDYQVALAEDGKDAASQIDLIMPDLLITDVEMPGMDGFALTLHLRANPVTAHLPIIMISGASDELASKAKDAGIDVLLGKPYSDEDLIGHIRRLVQA